MTAGRRVRETGRRRAPRTPFLRRLLAGGSAGLRRPALVAAAVAVALVAGAVTPGVVPSEAAWRDSEWMKGRLATENLTCGTSTGFTTTASSRFLRGSLAGTNLDQIAGLVGVSAIDDARPGSQPTPANATSPAAGVYVNPLAVQALGSTAVLDLTGLSAGAPAGYAGGLNQYVKVTETGTSAAASGLVSNSGGVGVTASTAPATLPGRATLSLAQLLPATTDITSTTLGIGAVASSSTLDWCAARASAIWGNGSVSGITRQYGIAGLELRMATPVVGTVTTAVTQTTSTALPAAATALSGATGSIARSLSSTVSALVPALTVGALTTTSPRTSPVIVTGVGAAATAVASIVTAPLRSADGSVSIDMTTGIVTADLAVLLGQGANGINGLDPNTQLVLNATVVNAIAARAGALIDQRNADIRAAMTTALQSVNVSIDATTRLASGSTSILDLRMRFEGTAAELAAGTKPFTITTAVLGLSSVLNPVLALLGLGTLTGLQNTLGGLATSLLPGVSSTVATGLAAPVTALGTTLTGVSARLVTALGTQLAPLPGVLSLMVNVQPDRPGAPAGSSYLPAIGRNTSAEYTVTALRLGLRAAGAVTGTPFSVSELATSTAGRNAYRTP